MHRLIDFPESIRAKAVAARLGEAGIEATVTTDMTVRGGWRSGMSTVWVKQASDLAEAKRVVAALTAEWAASETEMVCPKCGYDLRGHHGEARCPECGEPIRAAEEEVACPHCGEMVPQSFEECWNCGRPVGAAREPEES